MKNNIIAISGKSGCGNSTVSKAVAEHLNFSCINYTLRNMAFDMNIPFEELLEKARIDDTYDIELDKKQKLLCEKGNCVLGSRLAIWLLKENAFTVYLDALPETRYKRIASREIGNIDEITKFNRQRDIQDTERYKTLYGIDNDNFTFADLIISTDTISPSEIAHKIVTEFKKLI